MAIAALSPSSVMASPIQANPQVKNDMQASGPQVAQDAQKVAKSAQTDTITISAQALKMADEKEAAAKEATRKDDEQREAQIARDQKSAADEKNAVQRSALRAYGAAANP